MLIDAAGNEPLKPEGDSARFSCQDPLFDYLCELLAFEKLTVVANPSARLQFHVQWLKDSPRAGRFPPAPWRRR